MSLQMTWQNLSPPHCQVFCRPHPRKMCQHPLSLRKEPIMAHQQAMASEKPHSWFSHSGTPSNKECISLL